MGLGNIGEFIFFLLIAIGIFIYVDGFIVYQDSENILGHTMEYYAKHYPINSTVTVYYNPHSVTNAAFIIGFDTETMIFPLFAVSLSMALVLSPLVSKYKRIQNSTRIEMYLFYYTIIGFVSILANLFLLSIADFILHII